MRAIVAIYWTVLAVLCAGVATMAKTPQHNCSSCADVGLWSNTTAQFMQQVKPRSVPSLINFNLEDPFASTDNEDDDDEYTDVVTNTNKAQPRHDDTVEQAHHHHHRHEHHLKGFDVYAFCVSLMEWPAATSTTTVYLSVAFNNTPKAGHPHKFLATLGHYRSGKLRTNSSIAEMLLADKGVTKNGFVMYSDLQHLSGLLFVKPGSHPTHVKVHIQTTDPEGFITVYGPGESSHCDSFRMQVWNMEAISDGGMDTETLAAVVILVGFVACVVFILAVVAAAFVMKRGAAKAAKEAEAKERACRANYSLLSHYQSPPPSSAVKTYSLGPQQQQLQQPVFAMPLNMVHSLYPQLQQLTYSPASTAPAVVHTNPPPTYPTTSTAATVEPLPETGVTLQVPIN